MAAASAQSPCDPNLLQPTGNPYGYRLRGDRCEGVYIQQVGGSPLAVVSWTRAFPDYDLSSNQNIAVEWDAAHLDSPVRLRAQGLRHRLYYRMDALRPSNSNSFNWPTGLLSALNIPRGDAGIVGLAQASVDGASREIYLPLRVSQGSNPPHDNAYSLILLPGVELKEVYLTLTGLPSEAKSPKIKDGEAVGYGYYPAERPVEIPISGLKNRGFYHLEIGATLRSGGAAAAELWFYHPGN